MTRFFVSLGVEKVRLTGGEPLLRSGLVDMVRELATMRTSYLHDGTFVGDMPWKGQPLDIALTTNGHLLEDLAQPLKDAGLNRVTVSMDAVDAATFANITRVPRQLRQGAGRRSQGTRDRTRAGQSKLCASARVQRRTDRAVRRVLA